MSTTQEELRSDNDCARKSEAVNRMIVTYERKVSDLRVSLAWSRAMAVLAAAYALSQWVPLWLQQ